MGYVYPTNTTNVSDSFQDHVNRGSVNPGTDYTAAYGSPVWAVAAGVIQVADSSNNGSGGRTMNIAHDDGTGSDYLHLSSIVVGGGRVAQGQLIAYSGASGNGSDWYYGAHLHISFRPNHTSYFGNAGNQDFDAIMRQGGAEEDMNADQDSKLTNIYNAIFNGGSSMRDGGKSISQSLGELNAPVQRSLGNHPTALPSDGSVVLISPRQDNADTNTQLRLAASSRGQMQWAANPVWLLLSGVALILIATVVIPLVLLAVPAGTQAVLDIGSLEKFLIGAGAVLVGISIAAWRSGGAPAPAPAPAEAGPPADPPKD